jgi:(R,R)-butanediol dehydrogenase/meso-butanediol dehydrogenase/diacetyl reductase
MADWPSFAVVPAFSCARLPGSLADEDAALVEPTEVAVRAVRKSDLRPGGTVACVGGGTVGLLTLQVARAAGAASACLIEPRASRRELELRLRATAAFDPAQPDWQADLRDACSGVGPDVMFECAGVSESADLAVRIPRKGGRIVLMGIHPERVPLSTLDIVVGEKQLVGSVQHHFDDDLPVAVQRGSRSRVHSEPMCCSRADTLDWPSHPGKSRPACKHCLAVRHGLCNHSLWCGLQTVGQVSRPPVLTPPRRCSPLLAKSWG